MKKINFLLILFSLYLLSSCQNPADPAKPQSPSIPEGKGTLTLVISDINGRTILPGTGLSHFEKFMFSFYAPGTISDGSPVEFPFDNTGSSYTMLLLEGTYDLSVLAWADTEKDKPAAYGELLGIEIEGGGSNTGTVSLKPFTTGTGTFSWNITFPAGTTEASMNITPLDPTKGTPEQTLYFIGGPAGTTVTSNNASLELDSGYYNVLLTLIKNENTQKIECRDILHIYQNLESVYPVTSFSENDFYSKNYIITYNYNNGWNAGIETIYIDEKITNPPVPTRTNYEFGGWYTDPTLFDKTTEWNFNENTVTDDITLYARWHPLGKFTFQFSIAESAPIVDSHLTINQVTDRLSYATLKVTDAGSYSEITWYYNNKSQGTGGTITLEPSIFDNVSGPKFITVQAVKDNVLYSRLVIIWVQQPAAKIIDTDTNEETLYATLDDAIKKANPGTQTDPTEIIIMRDITVPETGRDATTPGTSSVEGYTISNKNIKLTVIDGNITINASTGSFALFTVNSGAFLTLDGSKGSLTLSGGGLTAGASRRGIYINGGTVTMNDNVIVSGFKCSSSYGGGVYMTGSTAARFTMNGGTIYGSSGDTPNTAASNYAAIYVGSGTAEYGNNYGTGGTISSTSSTLPPVRTLSKPTISPTSAVTYTKLYAVYSGSETVSYQWEYSSSSSGTKSPVSGATNPTYIPANSGYYAVTVSAPGYTSNTSDNRSVSLGTLTGKISINPPGLVTSGTTLTASYNGSEPVTNNVTINYQWRKDTTTEATASTYTPTNPGIYNLVLSANGYNSKTYNAANDIAAFITTPTVTNLTENNWFDGNFTTTEQQDWYSIDVSPDVTYYVWINNGNYGYGDGTKTTNTYISVIYDDGKLVCLNRSYSYSSSWSAVSFTPASDFTGKVYIQVKPYSTTGAYGIVYSTENARPINNTLTFSGITPTQLYQNTWRLDTLSSTTTRCYYSFNVTSGTTYYVWWNEKKDSSLFNYIDHKTPADVDVTVWYSSNKEAIPNTDISWDTPKFFTAETNDTVTVLVRPKSALTSNYGTFEIVYSEGNTRPGGEHNTPPNADPLTENQWKDGSLTSANPNKWYSFNVVSGTTYYVWWDDSLQGNAGTIFNPKKTVNIKVSGYYNDGTSIFPEIDSGWTTPRSFIANSTGTVYIYVQPYYSGYTGTYGVVYSTGSTRPALEPLPISATPLTINTWENGTLTSANPDRWYSFSVTSGTRYYIWWNDSYQGYSGDSANPKKTVDIKVSGYYSNGSSIFTNEDSGWTTPQSFTANSTGTVYIYVQPYFSGYTGTFGVVYSTGSTRPAL